MRALFLSGYSPLDLFMGTGEYNRLLLSHLAEKGCEIHYLALSELIGRRKLWLRDAEVPKYLRSLRITGWSRLGTGFFDTNWRRWLLTPLLLFKEPTDRKIILLLARLLGRERAGSPPPAPDSGRRHIDDTRQRMIRLACQEIGPDVVIVDGTFYGDCLNAVPMGEEPLKVIVTIDVYHQRAESLQRMGATVVGNALTWEEEADLLNKADVIVALQSEEAAVLQDLAPTRQVVTAPLAPVRLLDHGVTEFAGRCLFVGSQTDHNVVSLAWFLEDVWPRIITGHPGATLHVCGRVGEAFAGRSFPGVRFLGLVPELGTEYAAARVCLVPLRAGSGLKIKTVQALAQNKPCVVTGFGAQGMRHLDGKAFVIADEPAAYAGAVVDLLGNPERREHLRQGAVQAVAEFFSPEACYGPLLEAMRRSRPGPAAVPAR